MRTCITTAASEPIITFDGSKYTANTSSNFVIDGQTLAKEGAIMISRNPLSYAEAGTDVGHRHQHSDTEYYERRCSPRPCDNVSGQRSTSTPHLIVSLMVKVFQKAVPSQFRETPSPTRLPAHVVVGTSTEAVGLRG